MDVIIGNSTDKYVIENYESLGRINLLQGESSTGKTFFYELVQHYTYIEPDSEEFVYTGTLPLMVVHEATAKQELDILKSEIEPHLVIVDELCPFIMNNFKYLNEAVHETNHKFIIITRKLSDLSSIPIDSRNVYILETKGRVVYF